MEAFYVNHTDCLGEYSSDNTTRVLTIRRTYFNNGYYIKRNITFSANETRLTCPSHDLLCRSTFSTFLFSFTFSRRSFTVALLRYCSLTSSPRCDIHSRSLKTRFLASRCTYVCRSLEHPWSIVNLTSGEESNVVSKLKTRSNYFNYNSFTHVQIYTCIIIMFKEK